MSQLDIQALTTWPYIQIRDMANPRAPVMMELEPPIVSPPKDAAFAYSLDQLAVVYNMKRETMVGIGNPNDRPPQTGERLFSWDDRYLLFLGSSTDAPRLYRRSGPTFVRVDGANFPLPSGGVYFSAASFSVSGSHLAVVRSDDADTIHVYERETGDVFTQHATLEMGATVTELTFSRSGLYLVAKSAPGFKLFTQGSFAEIAGQDLPSGRLLAISPNDRNFVIDAGGVLKNYRYFGQNWQLHTDFGLAANIATRVEFSPDGEVMAISGAGVGGNPAFYSRVIDDDPWEFVSGINSAFGAAEKMKWSFDSTKGVAGFYSASKYSIATLRRDSVYKNPASRETYWSGTNTAASKGALSPDGQHVVYNPGNANRGIYKVSTNALLLNLGAVTSFAVYSPDGQHLISVENNVSPNMIIRKRTGDSYASLSFPYTADDISAVVYSKDGSRLFVASPLGTSSVPTIRVFTRAGDTYSLFASYAHGLGVIYDMAPTADGKKLVVVGANGSRLYDVSSSTWVQVANLDGTPNARVTAITSDEKYIAIGGGIASGSYRVSILKSVEGSYNPIATLSDLVTTPSDLAFSLDDSFLVVSQAANPGFVCYSRTDDRFTLLALPNAYPNVGSCFNFNSDGTKLCVIGQGVSVYNWLKTAPLSTFVLGDKIEVAVDERGVFDDLAYDGSLLHYQVGGVGHHKLVSDLSDVGALQFDPDFAPAEITDVYYSPSGRYVVWRDPDGVQVAVKASATSTFIKTANLDGVFISVYKRQENTYVEKDYAVHPRGTVVKNLVFSRTPLAFSYFAEGLGRLIYDVHGSAFQLKETIWETGLAASFIAFEPAETYFALTSRYSDAPSKVRLYKFDNTLHASQLDEQLVAFGPDAFSSCNDVVVAHGGTPNPITFYKVVNERLVEQSFPEDFDWQHEGAILDIDFAASCEQLIVLTPGETTTIIKDEDGPHESDTAPNPGTLPDGAHNDPTTPDVGGNPSPTEPGVVFPVVPAPDDGDSTIELPPPWVEPVPGGEGGVSPRGFLPYVSINVTYRH